ncbi:MAG: hypothetical protein WC476_01165 [Phycisphaerae bacterium]|jgi:hypothetical protein
MEDNETLKDIIAKEITNFFYKVLKDAELLTSNKYIYNQYRKHVLDEGNDAIRTLQDEISNSYICSRIRFVEEIEVEEE